MELWIRSQDREDLIKADNLGLAYLEKYNFVDKIGDIHRNEYHICQFTDNTHITLGYYKTKERALEVLDDIQNIICGNTHPAILKGAGAISDKAKNIFYEMPEE